MAFDPQRSVAQAAMQYTQQFIENSRNAKVGDAFELKFPPEYSKVIEQLEASVLDAEAQYERGVTTVSVDRYLTDLMAVLDVFTDLGVQARALAKVAWAATLAGKTHAQLSGKVTKAALAAGVDVRTIEREFNEQVVSDLLADLKAPDHDHDAQGNCIR